MPGNSWKWTEKRRGQTEAEQSRTQQFLSGSVKEQSNVTEGNQDVAAQAEGSREAAAQLAAVAQFLLDYTLI